MLSLQKLWKMLKLHICALTENTLKTKIGNAIMQSKSKVNKYWGNKREIA